MVNEWLARALAESRARGFLGPQSVDTQVRHAEGFAKCWESRHSSPPTGFLDLGSGGGLPGLVLIERWNCRTLLLDSMEKRCEFLREVVALNGGAARAEVFHGRAEDAARRPEYLESFDLVTARSFGSPAVTAECAARFLKVGATLVVSEPPPEKHSERWVSAGLDRLGLALEQIERFDSGYAVIVKTRPTPEEFPRSTGTPRKKPLF